MQFDPVTTPATIVISLLMTFLAYKNWRTYSQQGEYKDFRSVIITLGIFGTFFGLAVGISRFDTNRIDSSLPGLLEGLKLAFFTSVLGMGISILLTIYQKFQTFGRAQEDAAFDISRDTLETLRKCLGGIESGNRLVEEKAQGIENRAQNMIGRVSQNLESSVDQKTTQLISEVNRKVTAELGKDLKALGESLALITEWQTGHQSRIQEQKDLQKEILEEIKETQKNVLATAKVARKTVQDAKNLQTQTNETAAKVKAASELLHKREVAFQRSNSQFETFYTNLARKLKESSDIFNDFTNLSGSIAQATENTQTALEDLETQLPPIVSETTKVYSNLHDNLGTLNNKINDASKELETSRKKIKRESGATLESMRNAGSEVQSSGKNILKELNALSTLVGEKKMKLEGTERPRRQGKRTEGRW